MTSIKVIRIYTDSNGESQFADTEIPLRHQNPLQHPGDIQFLSDEIDLQAISFSELAPGIEMGWHPGSRHQYVVTLAGEIMSEVPNGEQRYFRPGVIALVEEDPNAYGHNTTVTSDVPWQCVFLPLKNQPAPTPQPQQQETPTPPPPVPASETTLQSPAARLVHVGSNVALDIPPDLNIIHIGKPNDRVPPDLDLSGFEDSEIVSQVHATLRSEGDGYYLEDAGSSNGTYVNSQPLRLGVRMLLRTGDRLSFGRGDKVSFLFNGQD